MDEGKEIKPSDNSLLDETRRNLQLGVPPNITFSRRFLSFAKVTHLPSHKPETTREPNVKASPWKFLQSINQLFRKKEEHLRFPEDTEE